jgi:hypothetical protein
MPYRDEEDTPLCDHCGHPLKGEADVDIDDETGSLYVSGWSAVCTNPDCRG